MLMIADRLGKLSFGQLMEVYAQGNEEKGREKWPEEPEMRQIALAETDFYDYLFQVFFTVPGAFYAVWTEGKQYVSALRLEPFRDGLLVTGLETRPDRRRQGYGARLLQSVLDQTAGRVYSHVAAENTASLRTHEKCGFQKVADHAVYADGSVDSHCMTLCRESS